MANCMLLHPNRSDQPKGALPGAVLSGGSWTRPLANLQARGFAKVAQSANLAPASTRFDVTLSAPNELFAVVLVGHNLTPYARLRFTAWYDDGSYASPAYQVMQDAYPALFFTEELPWEAENWWDGRPLSEELEGFTQNAILVLPTPTFARNWRIEIFDESNPAGYVRIARLWMAGGWQPSQNYDYGGSLAYETSTAVVEALSGAEYFDRREPFRVARIGFQYMDEDEALGRGLELCRRAGIDGELFWIANPDDLRNITRTSFLGRLRTLAAWEQITFERANIAFEIKELR